MRLLLRHLYLQRLLQFSAYHFGTQLQKASSRFYPRRFHYKLPLALWGTAVASASALADDEDVDAKVPKRLQRFRDFASVEYDRVAYMTPQDFLDSLILDQPRGHPVLPFALHFFL
jgi:hypothetical protein